MKKTASATALWGISVDHDKTLINMDGVIAHWMKSGRLIIHMAEKIERCQICRELGIVEIKKEG